MNPVGDPSGVIRKTLDRSHVGETQYTTRSEAAHTFRLAGLGETPRDERWVTFGFISIGLGVRPSHNQAGLIRLSIREKNVASSAIASGSNSSGKTISESDSAPRAKARLGPARPCSPRSGKRVLTSSPASSNSSRAKVHSCCFGKPRMRRLNNVRGAASGCSRSRANSGR